MEKKSLSHLFDCVWENQLVSEKINYRILAEIVVRARNANGNKEKEVCLTRRRRVGLASNLDKGIFATLKR